jgi:hypothetical protein
MRKVVRDYVIALAFVAMIAILLIVNARDPGPRPNHGPSYSPIASQTAAYPR